MRRLYKLFILPLFPILLGYSIYVSWKIVQDTDDYLELEELEQNPDKFAEIIKKYRDEFITRNFVMFNCICIVVWLTLIKLILL